MRRRYKFWIVFLLSAGPSPALLGAFALGLLVVGLAGDLLYDLLTAPAHEAAAVWRPAVAAALLTGLAYALYRRDQERKRALAVDESKLAPPHVGLVWLLGPGRFDHLLFALEHHRQGGGAAHCWLVMQDIEPVRETYAQLSQRLLEQGLSTQLHPVYIQELEVQAAYRAVRSVFEREAAEMDLRSDQVIADITGGTKPLTAGMVLAALTSGGALEYVESQRDGEGRPIPNTLHVTLVDIAFYVTKGEP
jgi:hypothetical protein